MANEAALESFLGHFNLAVAASTTEVPCADVWRESQLIALLSAIKKKLHAEGFGTSALPSNHGLIDQLQRIGLATPLVVRPAGNGPPGPPAPKFFRVEIGAGRGNQPTDVAEILQAYLPRGVLCYSSALRFYHLTSQSFSFQHIADVVTASADGAPDRKALAAQPEQPSVHARRAEMSPGPAKPRNSLGVLRFVFDGIACYTTRRHPRTVPGIQERILSPRARLRITTFEQTLLDTLHKPFYCGGPAIVFEAWHQHPERLNQPTLAQLLAAIGHDPLARRTGLMLENLEYALEPGLAGFMADVLGRIDRKEERLLLPLLPGLPYTSRNEKWMLLVP
jgi:hypothetical protein